MSRAFFVLQFRLNTLPVLVQMLLMDRLYRIKKTRLHRKGTSYRKFEDEEFFLIGLEKRPGVAPNNYFILNNLRRITTNYCIVFFKFIPVIEGFK